MQQVLDYWIKYLPLMLSPPHAYTEWIWNPISCPQCFSQSSLHAEFSRRQSCTVTRSELETEGLIKIHQLTVSSHQHCCNVRHLFFISLYIYETFMNILENDDELQSTMGAKVTHHKDKKKKVFQTHLVPNDILRNRKLAYQMDVSIIPVFITLRLWIIILNCTKPWRNSSR